MFLRNVGSYKSHTAKHPRRRHSSQSPPCKPQILQLLEPVANNLSAYKRWQESYYIYIKKVKSKAIPVTGHGGL
jgi:hypothetical protein